MAESLVRHPVGHWYDPKNSAPVFEVPKASGKGMKKTTIREARLMGLVPSVTTIQKIIAKPGLDRWIREQIVMSAMTLPRNEGEGEDSFARRVIEDSGEQAGKAAELGTSIHKAIELAIDGEGYDEELAPFVRPVENWFQEHRKSRSIFEGVEPMQEVSFALLRDFGGRVDLSMADTVIDWKSQKTTKGKFNHYLDHAEQLSAYAKGMGIHHDPHLINVYISTTQPGLIEVHEWDKWDTHLENFEATFKLWKSRNNWL